MTLVEIMIRYLLSGVAAWIVLLLYAGVLYARACNEATNPVSFRIIYNNTEFDTFLNETPMRTLIWLTAWPYGVLHVLKAYIAFVNHVKNETLNVNKGQ